MYSPCLAECCRSIQWLTVMHFAVQYRIKWNNWSPFRFSPSILARTLIPLHGVKPSRNPLLRTHAFIERECLSHWTIWVTVRRTDVSNGSEQTPLPSTRTDTHFWTNARRYTRTCVHPGIIFVTLHQPPLSLRSSPIAVASLHERCTQLYYTPHPPPPPSCTSAHPPQKDFCQLYSKLYLLFWYCNTYESGRGRAARKLQIIINTFTSASLLSAVVLHLICRIAIENSTFIYVVLLFPSVLAAWQ